MFFDRVSLVEKVLREDPAGAYAAMDFPTRDRYRHSIEELSRILHSLSQQLSQGRETIRITTRLPVLRSYTVGCPICGRGNRAGAKFCQACGASLVAPTHEEVTMGMPMPLRFRV